MRITPRGRRARLITSAALLAGTVAVLTAPSPAGAETIPAPGLTVTSQLDAATGRGYVTVAMTTARSLKVTCNGGVNVNGVKTKVPCLNLVDLKVTGSAGDDTVDVEGTAFSALQAPGHNWVYVTIDLGAGNDKADVRMRSGSVDIFGGPGNDRLSNAVYPSMDGFAYGGLYGEDGNDVLTNAGYLAGSKPVFDPYDLPGTNNYSVLLSGGAGADTITGAPDRYDQFDIDLTDTVNLGAGPAGGTVNLTSTTNVVSVDANGNYGPKLAVTTAGKKWALNLPTYTTGLRVNTLGGPDQVTVLRKSRYTPITVDTGTGADVLTVRPWTPYTWDKANNTVTQPGAQPISWIKRTATVKVVPLD